VQQVGDAPALDQLVDRPEHGRAAAPGDAQRALTGAPRRELLLVQGLVAPEDEAPLLPSGRPVDPRLEAEQRPQVPDEFGRGEALDVARPGWQRDRGRQGFVSSSARPAARYQPDQEPSAWR
jgi:hypothetical protein